MIRFCLLTPGLLALAGCVMVVEYPAPTDIRLSQVLVNETPTTTTVSVPESAPATPPASMPSKESTCAPFALPSAEPLPTIVDLTDPMIRTQQDVELALVQQIEVLREYIRTERQALTKAHTAYIARCRE